MSLKGSKTEQNLKDAFAGESQANRRYLYFANKADIEGQNDVAALFRSTAEGETGHAHGHLEFLEEVTAPNAQNPWRRLELAVPFEIVRRHPLPCRAWPIHMVYDRAPDQSLFSILRRTRFTLNASHRSNDWGALTPRTSRANQNYCRCPMARNIGTRSVNDFR